MNFPDEWLLLFSVAYIVCLCILESTDRVSQTNDHNILCVYVAALVWVVLAQ